VRAGDVELGYLAHPEPGSHPGVVVIHDVWGLSDHTRDIARRLAGNGFAALAVDLYRRLPKAEIRDPGRWIRELSDPAMQQEVQAGLDFLAAHPAVAGHRLAAIGFCMGGMYSLLAAAGCRGLSAAVVFYGLLSHAHGMLHGEHGPDPVRKPREPVAAAEGIGCPLLCFFGEEDEFVPLADVGRLRDALSGAAHPADVVVYPGAGHAFMNDTRPAAYRPELARRAWARMLEFLYRELGGFDGGPRSARG
jgi:carboxymethylenebutenolidase